MHSADEGDGMVERRKRWRLKGSGVAESESEDVRVVQQFWDLNYLMN